MEIMSSMRLLLTSFLLLAGMARSFGMSIPAQEKVYLHFDQTGYFLKETMWFTAYVLNESNRPTDISKVPVPEEEEEGEEETDENPDF